MQTTILILIAIFLGVIAITSVFEAIMYFKANQYDDDDAVFPLTFQEEEQVLELVSRTYFLVTASPTRLNDTTLPITHIVLAENEHHAQTVYEEEYAGYLVLVERVRDIR